MSRYPAYPAAITIALWQYLNTMRASVDRHRAVTAGGRRVRKRPGVYPDRATRILLPPRRLDVADSQLFSGPAVGGSFGPAGPGQPDADGLPLDPGRGADPSCLRTPAELPVGQHHRSVAGQPFLFQPSARRRFRGRHLSRRVSLNPDHPGHRGCRGRTDSWQRRLIAGGVEDRPAVPVRLPGGTYRPAAPTAWSTYSSRKPTSRWTRRCW